jgi:DNA-binding MarR family transcriptional regulator
MRLSMLTALAVAPALSFTELKQQLRTSDGNLSVHARRLEDAGYITCHKSSDGRTPRTDYRLTPAGRAALTRYLDDMEALIAATRSRIAGS